MSRLDRIKKKKKATRTITAAPALPFPNGGRRKIRCMEGCGTIVAGAIGICRKCRRQGKQRAAKVTAKRNKAIKRNLGIGE